MVNNFQCSLCTLNVKYVLHCGARLDFLHVMTGIVAVCVGNTYKLRADSHTKAIEWCRSLDMASRISAAGQVCVRNWLKQVKYYV